MNTNLSYWEIEELAAAMLGVTEKYDNETLEESIYELFYDKFECDTNSLHLIVEKLLPMIACGQTLSGALMKGFSEDGVCFIVKAEA